MFVVVGVHSLKMGSPVRFTNWLSWIMMSHIYGIYYTLVKK